MDKHIDAAIAWLSESDIRNKEEEKLSFGGINNGYFYEDKIYQYVYNEITGYAINAFIAIYQWTKDKTFLQFSKNAAEYLICQQTTAPAAFEGKAIPHSLILPSLIKVDKYYTFDNAIILHGMVNLFKETGENKYYRCCLEIGDWLITMQKDNGSFYSYYDIEDKVRTHPYDEFFFDNGCLHVKNAIGLIFLGQIAKEHRYTEAGLKICNWGSQLQANDGLFWVNSNRKYVFTHAHCYATEGYLFAYHLLRDDGYLEIARKAADALIYRQNDDGSLNRIYKNKISMRRWVGKKYKMAFRQWYRERKNPWKTVDATAQAARIFALLYSITEEIKYLTAAHRAIDFISSNQVLYGEDKNMLGGFYYQKSDNKQGAKAEISSGMYTWCTQFGLSALMIVKMADENKSFDDIIELLF